MEDYDVHEMVMGVIACLAALYLLPPLIVYLICLIAR